MKSIWTLGLLTLAGTASDAGRVDMAGMGDDLGP